MRKFTMSVHAAAMFGGVLPRTCSQREAATMRNSASLILHSVLRRLTAAAGLAAAIAAPAHAQGKLEAHYSVSMTGIAIGKADWTLEFGRDRYSAALSGRASGMLSVLVNGEGKVAADGAIRDGRPMPATFSSRIIREGDDAETRMKIDGGEVTELVAETAKPVADRVPVTEAHRKGIVDPVSALLVPIASDALTREACERTLPVFDGRRRYDLKLTFKRMDKVKAAKGYAGPVAVCAVSFVPQAGHRASSALIKFLSEGREIELWLAPVAGARLLVPFRASVSSLFGSLVVEATQFDIATQTAAAK
jgi:hypothetical protein